jgi:PCI domain-containing protein
MNLIRNWAVVLYFQPFATIKLDRMSAAFGWTIEEVEYHVVNLIQSGNIQGRVDSQNKVSLLCPFLLSFFSDDDLFFLKPAIDLASEEDRLSC